jgi:GNAT superfamily N-acetyltransferase
MSLVIRDANRDDSKLILRFVKELASYEKAEHEVIATEASIENSIFGEDTNTQALICEKDGSPIGFAVYFFNYSTWLGKHGLYLEDLYVTSSERGSGAGKALLKHLAKIAVEKGCGRFEWSVLDWNEPAIKFYNSLGAKPKTEWLGYQLTGANLHALAES